MSWDLFNSAEAASRPPAPTRAPGRRSNDELAHMVAAARADRAVGQPLTSAGDWTVSSANAAMREMLDAVFPPLWVVGEITNFTRARERLDEIARSLEGGDRELSESLALYEEGVRLLRVGEKLLTAAEDRVEQLPTAGDGFRFDVFPERS